MGEANKPLRAAVIGSGFGGIAAAIRLGRVESVDNLILTGRADGMQTFDESLRQLMIAGRITREVAEQNVTDPGLLYR